MTHICVSDLTNIGSDNDLSPGRRQAIIRTNAGILLIHRNGKVVRVTALVFTGDVEACLQRLQWIPELSPWRPFRFSVRPLGTNFSEILFEILILSFKKMRSKMSSAKWRLFRLDLNVIMDHPSPVWHYAVSVIFKTYNKIVSLCYNSVQYTVECRYNAVKFITILHRARPDSGRT